MKRARIVVADDDLYMRLRMNTLLQTDFDVVDAVSDGIALVEAAFRCHPDIIVTDISMPKMNGIEAVRKIRHILPDIKCIFITMHDENIYREKAKAYIFNPHSTRMAPDHSACSVREQSRPHNSAPLRS